MAVDGAGNVYVIDTSNQTVKKISLNGGVSTLAGGTALGGRADGLGAAARFNEPYGIAVNGSGDVFVADTYNRAVRKISAGGMVTTLVGTNSRFYYPQGIAVDRAGNLYVADGDNHGVSRGVLFAPPPPTGTGTARLTNVSARAFSDTGVGALTAGFVIAGEGTETLLIRGIGPGSRSSG